MAELLTIGEPLVVFASKDPDVSLDDAKNFRKYVAGAELNVAIGTARLGHSVTYISRVGNDPLGNFVTNCLKKANVNTTYLQHSNNNWTGFMMKQLVSSGDPAIYYRREQSAASRIDASELEKVSLDNVKLAHLTGIFAGVSEKSHATMLQLIHKLRQKRIPIVFDPNIRTALWTNQAQMIHELNHLASQAKFVLPGLQEGKLLSGKNNADEIADFYLQQSSITQAVIIKLGPKETFMKTSFGTKTVIPGYGTNHVIDTVGAGDGFAVGVITGILEHLSLEKSVQRGNAIGALAVQSAGDNSGYPSRQQLAFFMDNNLKSGSDANFLV